MNASEKIVSTEANDNVVLIVDLNNFARYPSIAIGYLVAVLRSDGLDVEVISPLAFGYSGVGREPTLRFWSLWEQRLRYLSAISTLKVVAWIRAFVADVFKPDLQKYESDFIRRFEQRINDRRPDIILISTYLMYKSLCEKMCAIAASKKIPVIIGGPYFAQKDVARQWSSIVGLTSLYAGEPENVLVDLVKSTLGDRDDERAGVVELVSDMYVCASIIATDGLKVAAGVNLGTNAAVDINARTVISVARPKKNLDNIPFPDYADFPWDRYANVVVPIITGRGCGWGRCQFCSDITSTSGRSYRSRSAENVLLELEYQSIKHHVFLFVFTDLKLNSNVEVWNALINNIQRRVPSAKWICSIHIGKDCGDGHLSKENLLAASKAGLTRITTGLESGSQRVLDLMRKGVVLSDVSTALINACYAGISVRTTMILGYPGEMAEDVKLSAIFLENHFTHIDRVMLNRFQLIAGTPLHKRIQKKAHFVDGFNVIGVDYNNALLTHEYKPAHQLNYLLQVNRLLKIVHKINKKPLSDKAKIFEGIM